MKKQMILSAAMSAALLSQGWAYTAADYDTAIARWQDALARDQAMLPQLQTVLSTATRNISIEQSNINLLESQIQSIRIDIERKEAKYRSNMAICQSHIGNTKANSEEAAYWRNKEQEQNVYLAKAEEILAKATTEYDKLIQDHQKQLGEVKVDQQEFKDALFADRAVRRWGPATPRRPATPRSASAARRSNSARWSRAASCRCSMSPTPRRSTRSRAAGSSWRTG